MSKIAAKESAIKNAAMKVVGEFGFHGATVSKIAKEANVSPGTVYLYHENKEEMMKKLYVESVNESVEYMLKNVDENSSASEIISEIVTNYYEFIITHKELYSFTVQFSNVPALVDQTKDADGHQLMFNVLTKLKTDGKIANFNRKTIYAIVFTTVQSIAMQYDEADNDSDQVLSELRASILDIMIVK